MKLPPRFVAELLMRCTVRERAAQARARELAASANLSAWLPQLRVRVGRYRDETLRLIPTEAEPDRWQLTDGADLRVDATAVWRLDRVVFASEEVALERALEQRAERVERRRREVLALLFKWHRAAWLLAAWSSGPDSDARVAGDPRLDERVELWLALVQVTAELDEWSGGWFSRHAPAFGAAE